MIETRASRGMTTASERRRQVTLSTTSHCGVQSVVKRLWRTTSCQPTGTVCWKHSTRSGATRHETKPSSACEGGREVSKCTSVASKFPQGRWGSRAYLGESGAPRQG